jgi:SSS family solute:Na+ symporter
MLSGLWMVYDTPNPNTGKTHFGGAQYALSKLGLGDTKSTIYTGIVALLANLVVVVVGTLVLRALRAPDGEDVTVPSDYEVDAGAPGVEPLPTTPEQELVHH